MDEQCIGCSYRATEPQRFECYRYNHPPQECRCRTTGPVLMVKCSCGEWLDLYHDEWHTAKRRSIKCADCHEDDLCLEAIKLAHSDMGGFRTPLPCIESLEVTTAMLAVG